MASTFSTYISRTLAGTRTMFLRVKQAAPWKKAAAAGGGVVALVAAGALMYAKCQSSYEYIHNQIDPASRAECSDGFSPDQILHEFRVMERRILPEPGNGYPAWGFFEEDVKNLMAGIDYRFTSGIRAVQIVGSLSDPVSGRPVGGRYFKDIQEIDLSNNLSLQQYFGLVRTTLHEVGHHVFWKLKSMGHSAIDGFNDNEERFAQVFSYYHLSVVYPDWKYYNSYKLNPPTPAEMEWMKTNLFCDHDPDVIYYQNPQLQSIYAKLFMQKGDMARLADLLSRMKNFPPDYDLAPREIRQMVALLRGEHEQIIPETFIEDLAWVRAGFLDLGFKVDQLIDVAQHFSAFGNQEFAQAVRSLAAQFNR